MNSNPALHVHVLHEERRRTIATKEVMPLIEATVSGVRAARPARKLLWDLHEGPATRTRPATLSLVTQVDITGLSPEVGTFVYRNRTVDTTPSPWRKS